MRYRVVLREPHRMVCCSSVGGDEVFSAGAVCTGRACSREARYSRVGVGMGVLGNRSGQVGFELVTRPQQLLKVDRYRTVFGPKVVCIVLVLGHGVTGATAVSLYTPDHGHRHRRYAIADQDLFPCVLFVHVDAPLAFRRSNCAGTLAKSPPVRQAGSMSSDISCYPGAVNKGCRRPRLLRATIQDSLGRGR